MKRIYTFKEHEEIPDDARPLGVILVQSPPKRPGEAPNLEPLFYYDRPEPMAIIEDDRKIAEIYGRSPMTAAMDKFKKERKK